MRRCLMIGLALAALCGHVDAGLRKAANGRELARL
ncbi:hypothetical protein ACVWZ3_009296 [Bradyrhizobium sp. i1.3.6]